MRKIYSSCVALAIVCGVSACSGVQSTQSGPLTFGTPEGDVENTFCSVFRKQNFAGDVASNSSDAPLWITGVQAVNSSGWDARGAVAAVVPEGESSLMGWTDEDLESADFKRAAERLTSLDRPVEVPAGENVQVALEGAVKNDAEQAEISQLKITYKTDLKSSKTFSVVGNIRYEWQARRCV
ncbi:hypothetical protein [Glutamicibacter sp. PS]|uniref:hypothetical protein n=1 Tax=Glutamicibacter sp. PS TaxID=3075634 RepID=UPI002848278E|nr:hypothetical protein [Glutamicibacter sp. PS]MDR4533479.1 hypothetical protein [Glutamicibacter sp. PS]